MVTVHGYSDSVTEYMDVLSPARIAQFLAANSWTCQLDRQFDQTWLQPSGVGERIVPVLLPREPSFVDYEKRLVEAAQTIARAYGWRIATLAEQVSAVHADLFFIRVNQFSADGTIPLRQATSLLDSIDQMIRAAAVQAYNPSSSGRGRLPGIVNEFLTDDVRMGHTKKGSFIITVAARIDGHVDEGPATATTAGAEQEATHSEEDASSRPADSADEEALRANDEEAVAPVGEEAPVNGDHPFASQDAPASFTRQVMTTLARSLDITRRHVSTGDDSVPFDVAVEEGLRLPIVHALQEIGDAEGLQSIDLSFEWAAIEPQRQSVPSHIELDRPAIEALPELERRLTKSIVPARTTVIGPVTELKRTETDAESGEDNGGEIVIRADIEGRLRRVTIELAGADYDWAIRAHRAKLPFTATGEFGKKGNVWHLNEPIEVDRSFLEFRLDTL